MEAIILGLQSCSPTSLEVCHAGRDITRPVGDQGTGQAQALVVRDTEAAGEEGGPEQLGFGALAC
jgi:hypothetical protein